MGLLDSTAEEPSSKLMRYIMTGSIFVLLLALGLWWVFRFHGEKKQVSQFMDAVVAGDFQKAYEIWKPSPGYSYQDFLEDWSPSGFYGPVKSYRIEGAGKKAGASGVVVIVAISPHSPFPDEKDTAKMRRVREVKIWVESKDHSMSFAP